MKGFGLACEGITDQITIENILFGIFDDIDEEDISYIQPIHDATDEKGQGGWTRLLEYLGSTRFQQDLAAFHYLIIQVDTDVASEIGFDVRLVDDENKPLTTELVVEKVIERLAQQIDKNVELYEQYKHRIIFSISVSSLECWLYNFYVKDNKKFNSTHNCFDKLLKELAKDKRQPALEKNKDVYDGLSAPFMKRKNIDQLIDRDTSFAIFIETLRSKEFPVDS
ncbi:hypothetical protein M445_01460 [Vibrio owensii 47666-1]|uniref:hypothetical protein n=1 Tax=Vibrio owensii TaxID=696485 RepID=UPI0005843C6E|nr:hypothetical protein [Vibrio owensii]KIF49528.1 hypothetical protein M445_01460 [Vibrio owensii 47666-1]